MKKKFLAVLAALAVFALAFTGCKTDGDSGGSSGGGDPSKENRLRGITIDGGVEATWGSTDDGKTIDNAVFTKVNVSSATKASAEVSLRLASSANFGNGKIRVGKLTGTEYVYQNYSETAKPKFALDDNDKLIVEVTAENGDVAFYGAGIVNGHDTSLKSVVFKNQAAEVSASLDDEIGKPAATLDAVTEPGAKLLSILQPLNGFQIAANSNDSFATVSFGLADAEDADWVTGTAKTGTAATTTPILFEDADDVYLGVKVTAEKGDVAYYKIKVELQKSMDIPFGSPKLYNTADKNDAGYVDPVWNDIPWIPVARQNRAETTEEFYDNPSTSAKAKLYWDDVGLWLYAEVEGPVSTDVSFEHKGSSVELFINEAYPDIKTGSFDNVGGQYRVDSNGAISGDPTAAVDAFRALDKYKEFRTDKGYSVMYQAPWRFTEAYPLKDNKSISLEIQINAASDTGVGRVGVLKWYNTVSNTYQNVSYLALGVLKLGDHVLPANKPNITTQPRSVIKAEGDSVTLTAVAAQPEDGGTLSYQWFKTESAAAEGTAITSASGTGGTASYELTAAATTTYYYVVFTNTLSNGSTGVTKSSVAAIVVSTLTDSWTETVTIRNTSAPVYGFYIDENTFGDYDRIKVSIQFTAEGSTLTQRRLRAWGNYDYFTWPDADARPGMSNASPGGLLLSTADPMNYTAGTWDDYTIMLNNRDILNSAAAIKASTGVILLAFAPVPPGGGSGNVIYEVKNITLENADGSKKVKALHPNHEILWGGAGNGAYVTQAAADTVTRVLGQ